MLDIAINGKIEITIGISYEIICAPDLIAPRKLYLELLAHPENIIAYTLIDDINKTKIRLKLISETTKNEFIGIVLQLIKLKKKDAIEAKINK